MFYNDPTIRICDRYTRCITLLSDRFAFDLWFATTLSGIGVKVFIFNVKQQFPRVSLGGDL
jgi:hypothetical protein